MSTEYNEEQRRYIAVGLALGVAVGCALGVAFGNLAFGLGPGIALGLAFGLVMAKKHAPEPGADHTMKRPDEA